MTNIFDPNLLKDTAADSLMKNMGEQASIEGNLVELQMQLGRLSENANPSERASLQLEIAHSLQLLGRGEEAWPIAFTAFGIFKGMNDWDKMAETCDVLYQTGQADSLSALGQGIWLGVTFPINPETTVHLLSHVVDDTPDDSDGAAVAAATAAFLADIRTKEGPDRDRLIFFAQQLLGTVARRHSNVETLEQFEFWVEKLELSDPDKFLIRLRNVVDVLVQDNWWFDRERLQETIPAN